MVDKDIYVHTNVLAPYRQHMFAIIKASFRTATFLYYENREVGRSWTFDASDWGVETVALRRRLFGTGRFSISLYLLRVLFFRRAGSVHLVAMNGNIGDLLLVWFAAVLGRCQLILWSDGALDKCHSTRLGKLYRLVARHGAEGIFTAGQTGRDYALKMGFASGEIANSYFSHDAESFDLYYKTHRYESRRAIRARYNIPIEDRVILNVSRLLPSKRLVDLSRALVFLEGISPELSRRLHVFIIGDGGCHDYEEALDQLRVIRVHLINQMAPEDLLPFYSASDLFVFPSEEDVWGLVVNEALSMGLPVICCRIIGAAELVCDGENGYKVPARCPDAIARRIADVLQDDDKLSRFRSSAREIIENWNTKMGIRELCALVENGGKKCS